MAHSGVKQPLLQPGDPVIFVRRRPTLLKCTLSALLLIALTLTVLGYFLDLSPTWPFDPDDERAIPELPELPDLPGGLVEVNKTGYKIVEALPGEFLPRKPKKKTKGQEDHGRRLIFIGDVHGSFRELKRLLHKLSFDSSTDHLVFLGDILSRGPRSLKVLDLAIAANASCVRGNHEDKILLYLSGALDDSQNPPADRHERRLARKLSEEQVKWLEACPVILDIGDIPGYPRLRAVHAGLMPEVPLRKQDPFTVMNIRSINPTTGAPSMDRGDGVHWAKVWNKAQKRVSRKKRQSIVYGHFAYKGLDVRKWTTGLDGNCVRGGWLYALVHDGVKGKIKGVDCGAIQKEVGEEGEEGEEE